MSDVTTKVLNANLSDVLESLNQEPLTDEQVQDILEEQLEKFAIPAFDFEKEIKFESTEAFEADILIARSLIMESMDKSKKLSDMIFDALLADTTNINYLTLAQDSTKNMQASVKTLADIHNAYHKIVGQKKRNTLLVPPEDDEVPKGVPEGGFDDPETK